MFKAIESGLRDTRARAAHRIIFFPIIHISNLQIMFRSKFACLVFLSLSLRFSVSTWLFKEAPRCNPAGSGLIPFSGFKIYREFKSQGLIPFPTHYLILIHCDHGKVNYEAMIPMPDSTVAWEQTFCMLKPKLGKLDPLPVADSVENVMDPHTKSDFESLEVAPSNLGTLAGVASLIRHKIDRKLEQLTKRWRMQYTGKRMSQHKADIQSSTPQKVLEWESRDLHCYKMARRKKYAKRNLSFYMPETFVGGLYECPLTDQMKLDVFKKMSTSDLLTPLNVHFDCDAAMARPILPLIAEDSTRQIISYLLAPTNPKFVQTIPYLTTASPLNLRFASTITPDMHIDTWASRLSVNEAYIYTDVDLHYLSRAIALTTDFLYKLFVIDLSKIPLELGTSREHKLEDEAYSPRLLSYVQKIGKEEKLFAITGLLTSTQLKLKMTNILRMWDKALDA